ncbi:MAG: NADH-quinone oxidoreductase subunit C [Clostridiales Family XIII bacterium]|jgi:ech hydrogenase subunit D|nr:NADH-quinone oxidoreductase subunit C [Clostridiales Family XIII bacterium]
MTERKDLIQEIVAVEASNLLETVSDVKNDGYRLGQICATKTTDGIEVLYSFEKDVTLKNFKVTVGDRTPELHSITAVYWPAFIYENEMHDLFGITFKNLALDYGGNFFKIAKATPWNPNAVKAEPAEAEQAEAEQAEPAEAEQAEPSEAEQAEPSETKQAEPAEATCAKERTDAPNDEERKGDKN